MRLGRRQGALHKPLGSDHKPLVMEFVRRRCPELIDRILAIFSRRGAYGRYKDLLVEKNMLEDWYDFENKRTREALLKWCELQGITIEPASDKENVYE